MPDADRTGPLGLLLRSRILLVGVVAMVAQTASLMTIADGPSDWDYFTWAAQALQGQQGDLVMGHKTFSGAGDGGLSLYADFPFLQIGPPAILVAALLGTLPGQGLVVASTLVLLLGLAVIALFDRAFDDGTAGRRLTLLLGGAAAAVTWVSLARFVHLDDALTLLACAGACIAVRRQQWTAVGLLAGAAATSKPWGLVAVALVLVAPSWPARVRSSAAAAGVVLVFWGPFVLADPGTLALGRVPLIVTADSVPALVGLDSISVNGPLRLLQMLGGLVIACVLVLRGRWELALAAAFAWRLLLDPAPYAYYLAALVTAVLLVDLTAYRRPAPVLSLTVVTMWFAVSSAEDGTLQAVLHLVSFGGVLAVCVLLAVQRTTPPSRSDLAPVSAAAPS